MTSPADASPLPTAATRAAPTGLRAALQGATRAQHEQLDDALGAFDLADRTGYRRFLGIHLDAMSMLASRCGDGEREDVAALLDCLRNDLETLGGHPEAAVAATAPVDSPFDAAGTAYVIRGSRLGAAFLVRRVGEGLPVAYLGHRVDVGWGRFLATLAALDAVAGPADVDRAVASARAAFATFALAASAAGPSTAPMPADPSS